MADIAELIVALKLKDGLSGGLGNLNSQLKGMQGGLRDVGRGIGQVGSGLDRIATRGAIAAGAALTGIITTAASFEQAFTGVEKTVDGTDAQLAELEETLRGMARTMPVSFEELAAIGEQGGALGIARESLDEFVDVVARLAVSTDLSADQAATSLGKLGTILHLSGSDFEDLADSLVALGNAGGSTESEIVEVAQRFAAAGNAAGLTKEEILALASATTSMGIEIEAAGSSLSRIFNSVATNIGTSSDKAVAFADTLGLSAAEFRKAWEKDALGTFQDFLGELSKLDQFEQANVLQDIGITGVRDVNAVKLMTQNLGFFEAQLKTSTDAQKALRKESDKFFGTATANFEKLKNIGRDSLATIGEGDLLPAINEEVERLANDLNKPEVREGLRAFGKDLADGFRSFVKEIRNADFGPLIDTMKGAAAVAKGAFDAFRSLPEPIQQLALAAIVANKATGGGLGSVASGLGNILKGLVTIKFGRGESPARPMFVQDVTGGLGGGVGAGGKAGKGANLLGAAGLAGFALALIAEVGTEVDRTLNPIGHSFNELLSQTKGRPGSSILAQRDLQELSEATGKPITALQSEMIPLLEAGNKTWDQVLAEVRAANVGPRARSGSFGNTPESATGSDTVLTREFGGKLDKLATNDVIEHLSRTTEIGLKDVGTSFQTGIKTGLDPVGDIATKILARAEDPKAPPVMAEIKGHLSGLEEIQASYLANGDIKLADKVQTNIDTLHSLIGTVDQERAVTQARAAAAATSDAAMLATARLQATKIDSSNTRLSTLNSTLAAKRFDPKITTNNNITIPVNLSVNASVIQRQIYTLRTTTGSGGFI